jgi:hypothetical protein
MRKRQIPRGRNIQDSTLRDFSGGLNLADNEQNLSPIYQTTLKNMYRGEGGALNKRFGTKLFCKIDAIATFTMSDSDSFLANFTLSTSPNLALERVHHGLTTGESITFGSAGAVNGVTGAAINGSKTVTVIDAHLFTINVGAYTPTDAGAELNLTGTYTYGASGTLSGSILNMTYYNDHIVVATTSGEIGKINGAGVLTAIWNETLARAIQDSRATFSVTNAQANTSTVYSGTIGSVVLTATNTTSATDGATLASLLQTTFRAADAAATDISVAWAADVLTITDNRGRQMSAMTLDGGGGAAAYDNPDLWSTSATQVNFAEFGGELIIVNGVDKPVLVSSSFSVNYLVDLAAGTNTNVPVCQYVAAINHFVVMAGDPTSPNTLYISHKDASGTWAGDAAPNVGRNDDLSKIAGTSDIRGLGRFRDRLVVSFDSASIFAELDRYTAAGAHDPLYQDAIEQNGSISHRAMISVGDDFFMCDNNGVPSVAQALLTSSFRPKRASRLVDPGLRSDLRNLNLTSLVDRVFAIYNRIDDQYMLFVPNHPLQASTTQTTCWVFTSKPSQKIEQWSKFEGWNFRAACRSFLNRVFFADATRIYVYGTESDQYYADYINGPSDTDGTGSAVAFDIEFPWVDFGQRPQIKQSRYVQLETTGDSAFTLEMYIDNIRYDEDDLDDPALSVNFVGGSVGGYGNGSQTFGGGRRTIDERVWNWPSKFKIAKFRLKGSSKKDLRLISLTVLRLHGSIRR